MAELAAQEVRTSSEGRRSRTAHSGLRFGGAAGNSKQRKWQVQRHCGGKLRKGLRASFLDSNQVTSSPHSYLCLS